MKMNIPVIFQFLKDLSANNNREWFNEHRSEYEVARAEFDNFLATVIARISLFDETIRGIQPKDCTYRIYRDTRFSADKTPYKIHFTARHPRTRKGTVRHRSAFSTEKRERSGSYF